MFLLPASCFVVRKSLMQTAQRACLRTLGCKLTFQTPGNIHGSHFPSRPTFTREPSGGHRRSVSTVMHTMSNIDIPCSQRLQRAPMCPFNPRGTREIRKLGASWARVCQCVIVLDLNQQSTTAHVRVTLQTRSEPKGTPIAVAKTGEASHSVG